MDWVKLSTRFYLDPAVASLPDADTELLFVRSLAYAGAEETEGFIPSYIVPTLIRRRRYGAAVEALVARSLWIVRTETVQPHGTIVPVGWQIARWDDWQDELDSLARRRANDRQRKRSERARKKAQDTGMSRDMSEDSHVTRPPPIETEKKTSTANAVEDHVRADIERVCTHLADRIEANGSKRPVIGKRWRDSARLMLDADGRTEEQVHRAIDWCQDHEFWRSVVLSMAKLRQRYDQLRLQAGRREILNGRQAETDAQFARQMARAQARENNDPERNGAAHPLRPGLLPAAGDG